MGISSIGLSGSLTFKGVFYALIGLGVAFTLYPAIEAILQPIGIKMLWRGDASSVLRLKSAVDILLILFNAVLLGPIAEEIIFRGYVFTAFKQARQNILSAYILSAIVFASAHIAVGPGTIIFIFFWSFIPAFLYLKFGNLYPAILFHILNNFVTYIVFPLWIL